MKTIIANWKMNHSFDESDEWLETYLKGYSENIETITKTEVVLCPPAVLLDYFDSELIEDSMQFLELVMKQENRKIENFSAEELNEIIIEKRPLRLGAQNCHHEASGSFTGDISVSMLRNVGCEYIIIGHSERRTNHAESDKVVAKKVAITVKEGLIPVLCVGESKEIREKGKHIEFVTNQLLASIPQEVVFKRLIIAYEPIWSIGSGIIPTMSEIFEMTQLIKKTVKEKFNIETSVLYGGSVSAENSGRILNVESVDGLLVGKASLDATEFLKICLSYQT